ncbi:hypothetical protein FHR83_001146 [Actinoplanes campanulatus]|uniref:Uncharacterized protein n=1 Tax=Actinoplanes campanulatus TaxID=113559 RepID=A0A7W5AC04_9ACTN|nr:hypothetical protein [Actinoplanes campanulatus]MBB3093497.1 hypothetical protein [Actinoplanes campanulatus]GGN03764.1 hypothetical protein GCM10010109_10140 [Actinoplanes campanulatus]GID35430.1 hypothetical protein Aca09nite_19360 [Actinoplanes campanulatus]
MSLWRNVRGEMAGAWRSVCYDLGRRPAGRDPRPDVTSTGMSTFPGSLVDLPEEPPRTDARPPRRFVAVTAFCALGLTGAAGSYLVATTTFAGETADRPSAPPAVAAPLPPDQVEPVGGVAGMGAVPVARERRPRVVTKARPVEPAPTTVITTRPPSVARTSAPGCDCETPPAPTPTAAPSATSAEPDISASPSASGSVSPSPDISGPSGDSDRRHRRWRR